MGIWGSLISGGLSLLGGSKSKKAANSAADAQVESARIASEELRRQFDLARSDLQPYVAPGQQALDTIQQGSTIQGLDQNLGSIMGSETFGNLRAQRLQSLNSSQGQRGLLRSGQGLREIADLDTELALGLEGQMFTRNSGLAANAQAAAAGQAGQAIQAGTQLAGLQTQAGNAQAAGIVGGANATNGMLQNLGNIAAEYLSNKG